MKSETLFVSEEQHGFFLPLILLFRVGFDFYRELWEWESKSEGFLTTCNL